MVGAPSRMALSRAQFALVCMCVCYHSGRSNEQVYLDGCNYMTNVSVRNYTYAITYGSHNLHNLHSLAHNLHCRQLALARKPTLGLVECGDCLKLRVFDVESCAFSVDSPKCRALFVALNQTRSANEVQLRRCASRCKASLDARARPTSYISE